MPTMHRLKPAKCEKELNNYIEIWQEHPITMRKASAREAIIHANPQFPVSEAVIPSA
jgi:hypothetical protein